MSQLLTLYENDLSFRNFVGAERKVKSIPLEGLVLALVDSGHSPEAETLGHRLLEDFHLRKRAH